MPKVCPFRKKTYHKDKCVVKEAGCNVEYPPMTKEDFMECYESKCAVYDEVTQTCGMVNQTRRI